MCIRDRQNTTLSLFTHGKLVNCEVLEDGYGKWLAKLCEENHLSPHVGYRLVQNTCCLKEHEAKMCIRDRCSTSYFV